MIRTLEHLKQTTFFVTGVAGFIGFHLCHALLSQGHEIVGVDNLNDYYDVNLKKDRLKELAVFSKFHFYQMDIQNRHDMTDLWNRWPNIHHIIHLAAQAGVRYSLENPYSYIESNLMGQAVILELCRHRKDFQHLIYASSSSVYGKNQHLPFDVKDRCDQPISLYAATKKADELISQSYAHLYRIPMTGLRFFTVYGPWGRPDMATFIFTKAILENHPIKVFNFGHMKRDFTYIDDIIDGILGSVENPTTEKNTQDLPHRLYNLGCHKSESLKDFICLIEKNLGKKATYDLCPLQKGDVIETYANIESSQQDLGFSPRVSIDQGLPKFINWYRQYFAF
ncbi:MAG: NAD-dependent epimerase/dehydratase family protein [Janthinobacterium lividum]